MKLNSTISTNPVDELCQMRDELRVIWMALGNDEQADAYRVEIGEHINGLANRLADLIAVMSDGPVDAKGSKRS